MDSVTERFLAARKRREIRHEEMRETRVELPIDQITRIDLLEQQLATMARVVLDIKAQAMTPADIIETVDAIKRQRVKC